MTTTITTGNSASNDFYAYIASFNQSFASSGRGIFSNGLSGDYGSSATEITETPTDGSLAYIMRNNVVYDMNSHTLSGTLTEFDFGTGAYYTDIGGGSVALSMASPAYTVEFSPEITGDTAVEMIYGMLDMGDASDADIAALIDLMIPADVKFLGAGGDDVFTGTSEGDVLKGKVGDDTLKGGKGADKILGGNGADTLKGNNGRDTIKGGNGNDDINGGNNNDTLMGGNGRDLVNGGKGADLIEGGKGNDILLGKLGNDTINGGNGADEIDAGAGRNTVSGGNGTDTFLFTGDFKRTVVEDMKGGKDTLDLSDLGEVSTFAEFKDASVERNGKVVYDMDGDGSNVIVLLDTTLDDLSASDFIF